MQIVYVFACIPTFGHCHDDHDDRDDDDDVVDGDVMKIVFN